MSTSAEILIPQSPRTWNDKYRSRYIIFYSHPYESWNYSNSLDAYLKGDVSSSLTGHLLELINLVKSSLQPVQTLSSISMDSN